VGVGGCALRVTPSYYSYIKLYLFAFVSSLPLLLCYSYLQLHLPFALAF
jgi:hypothetical protein